jgi:signal transduction histidine kinase
MRTPELFQSSAFRLALAFAVTMTVAISIIFGFVYLQITASTEMSARSVLVAEAEKGATYSDAEIRAALNLRLTRDLRRLDYVALFDAAGRPLVGNLAALPPIPTDGMAHLIATARPLGDSGRLEPGIFVARLRADGDILVLGRSLAEIYALRETVLTALATAFGPMLILALTIGAFFARRSVRRLNKIHASINRIMHGHLHVRLPVRKTPDEIDTVSRDVNLMLDEIVRLLLQIKSVGDDIAHDLRTPLAVVRAKLERGEAGADPEEMRDTIRDALRELDRALAIITTLLRIAEIENDARRSEFRPIDLAAICADMVEFYEPLAQAKSVSMMLDADHPVEAFGDPDLMREAVSNLLDNAVKFTPPGGSIVICAHDRGGRAAIRITDTGPGIAPVERDKIFQRFYRTAPGDGPPGTGLGLSIASAITSLHGFDLRVVDADGGGAAFLMTKRADPYGRESICAS